ncbi:enoyl-CoA hydratase-related protein [Aestuariirhabdus sp. Z084]|uniref:enoyl-CoA hydratase-related protein n=1 Tax=Aestuariirhabdus haliotis TaxID=2918751 RepID=UPI00201B3EA0|nr:enoyl-CoA hydratase-related protein [Aestuariirhabdus haliotis]MCL6416797.1 enoyl-CoA hydratase-related protein [Aestuariirhabdus haliotis]MCL6420797.1 enoyl-CoA hydratase-related protein [Aestuariirhabdus haliotis]
MNQPQLTDSTLTIDGRVALLTFNRHDVRNALTGTALVDEIVATVEWANRNPYISVLVMTGAGSAFSAGGNIKEMAERDGEHRQGAFGGSVLEVQQKYREGIQRMPLAMERAEIPVIAAVNGPAIGAGFDLSCMCDLRIGCENTLLGETFINLGIIPGDGGAWFLQRLIGYQRAAELTLSGRLIKADEALELGILLKVVEAEQLLPSAMELAQSIAAKPPQTLRMTKRLLKMAQRQPLEDFLSLCASFQGMCHNTEDHLEAVNAFLEKRPGQYQGK